MTDPSGRYASTLTVGPGDPRACKYLEKKNRKLSLTETITHLGSPNRGSFGRISGVGILVNDDLSFFFFFIAHLSQVKSLYVRVRKKKTLRRVYIFAAHSKPDIYIFFFVSVYVY